MWIINGFAEKEFIFSVKARIKGYLIHCLFTMFEIGYAISIMEHGEDIDAKKMALIEKILEASKKMNKSTDNCWIGTLFELRLIRKRRGNDKGTKNAVVL